MGLNIKAIMEGTEDPEDIFIISAMTILNLGLMVHYIKYIIILEIQKI